MESPYTIEMKMQMMYMKNCDTRRRKQMGEYIYSKWWIFDVFVVVVVVLCSVQFSSVQFHVQPIVVTYLSLPPPALLLLVW